MIVLLDKLFMQDTLLDDVLMLLFLMMCFFGIGYFIGVYLR